VAAIMEGSGSHAGEAQTIARRLVDSNLVGHDSHGVLRVPKYLEWVGDGWLRPNQTPTVVFDSDALAIVDGNRGFGQVIGEHATRLGIAKAAKTGVAMIGLRNCGHLGRLGDWADMAAEAGQVSLHFLNTSGAQRVAPFGGSDRRLSTNPMAVGVPRAGAEPLILDITTSTVAEGKRWSRSTRASKCRPGGSSTARADLRPIRRISDGGALLTIGATRGQAVDHHRPARGAVTTGRSSDPDDTVLRNNMLSIFIAPSVYDPDNHVAREARASSTSCSPAALTAGQPVQAPGDVERATRKRRLADGVPLDDKTLSDLAGAAKSVGVEASSAAALLA
jgi:uncharacterized oxidoreductase